MAADLHIHVFEGITEDDLRGFFSNTLGSKYFSPQIPVGHGNDWLGFYNKIANTPSVWVGYVPDIVNEINELIGEDLPVCDDSLINRVKEVYIRSESHYSTARSNKVVAFLEEHKGKKLFTVSW